MSDVGSYLDLGEEEWSWFFFFQAEDGIRDYKVTGVQTCALPILWALGPSPLWTELYATVFAAQAKAGLAGAAEVARRLDRKSTRLNSSHLVISYAVFCLKKKKNARVCLAIFVSTHT